MPQKKKQIQYWNHLYHASNKKNQHTIYNVASTLLLLVECRMINCCRAIMNGIEFAFRESQVVIEVLFWNGDEWKCIFPVVHCFISRDYDVIERYSSHSNESRIICPSGNKHITYMLVSLFHTQTIFLCCFAFRLKRNCRTERIVSMVPKNKNQQQIYLTCLRI